MNAHAHIRTFTVYGESFFILICLNVQHPVQIIRSDDAECVEKPLANQAHAYVKQCVHNNLTIMIICGIDLDMQNETIQFLPVYAFSHFHSEHQNKNCSEFPFLIWSFNEKRTKWQMRWISSNWLCKCCTKSGFGQIIDKMHQIVSVRIHCVSYVMIT